MYSSTVEAPVVLIGAAHVVDLETPLRATFAERVFDGVAVELDAERAAALLAPEGPQDRPTGGSPIFLRLWAVMQKRLGEQMGAGVAGAEMRATAAIAEERKLPLFFIDDPIRETLGKLIRSMSFRERISLVVGAVLGIVLPTRVVERQLEDYQEAPADYLEELRAAYPAVTKVLLDDRNDHMATRLAELRGRGFGRLVAVVGDAHVPGLAAALRRRAIPVETISLGTLRSTTGPSASTSPGPRPT